MKNLLAIATLLLLTGCAGALQALMAAQQGAQYLDAIVQQADNGTAAWFARHPNQEAEARVAAAFRKVLAAKRAMNETLRFAKSASDADVLAATEAMLDAYEAWADLLAELGIPEARVPDGGAETEAPMPPPFRLPSRAELEGAL
jgi:uncharacterized protein YceK